METYCVSYKKHTANRNSSVKKTKQNRVMLLSICAVSCKRKLTFIKNKELSNGLFKMNKITNKFLLTGDKFMPELHLKQAELIVFVDHLLNIVKELKNLGKQVI